MTSYDWCKYFLNTNDEIVDEWQKSDKIDCIDESIELLCDITNKIQEGELILPADMKFKDSFHSIHILYENRIIDNFEFETLSIRLLDQIIEDMKIYVKYKENEDDLFSVLFNKVE